MMRPLLAVLLAATVTALRPLRPPRALRGKTSSTAPPAPRSRVVIALARKRSPLDDLLNNYGQAGGGPPPGGGGLNLLPVVGLGLFFAFPGFFLGALNNLLIAVFVLPPLIGFGFNFWAKRAILNAPCPTCGAVAAGMKSQGFTQCFNCGSELSLTTKGDAWRTRSKFDDPVSSAPGGGFGGGGGGPPGGVIDVEATDVE